MTRLFPQEKRTEAPNGRRQEDRILTRALKFIAILGALGSAFAFVQQTRDTTIRSLKSAAEIDTLKADFHGLTYMTCVSFAEKHAAIEIPAVCRNATK